MFTGVKSLVKGQTLIITFALILILAVSAAPAWATGSVFINEIHYDNTGGDTGEAVEIAGPAGTDLTGWSLVLYNGNGGGVYDTAALVGTITDQQNGCGTISFNTVGIQNGSPDGVALVDPSNNVVQFLSYEGSLTATDGPANGMLSTDIGVVEGGSDPIGESLQLSGTGSMASDFTWSTSAPNTFGAVNTGQTFDCGGSPATETPTDTPEPTETPPAPDVVLSEIRIDQDSTDNDEYFELAGAPGTSLDGLTYLVIGDGTGGSGVIEAVVDLTGSTIPGSGYFVAAEGTFSLAGADLTTNLNFENSDNVTHMLVYGFTGSNGDDLDTNDDGTFDSMPWSDLVDSIALVETPGSGEQYYGPNTIGPDGSFVPGHVFLCTDGWHIGAFSPLGANDTPGAANDCAIPVPDVSLSEIRIDQDSTDNDEYFELAGAAGTSLDGFTYLVIGDGAGGSGTIEAVVDLTGSTIPGSGFFVAAEGTFSLATADLTTNLNFENSDNVTHLLVYGFTGANGDDLDTDDDGTLDSMPWAVLVDSIALVETPGSGDQYYGPNTIGPDGSFVPGHVYVCEDGWHIGAFSPLGANDTPGAANDCVTEPPPPVLVCGDAATATFIHDAQGAGFSTPLSGPAADNIIFEGVVVGDFQNTSDQLGGFFLQEEDTDADANPMTSEGIFVYDNGFGVNVAPGDVVRVQGEVSEQFGMTELGNIDALVVCSTGASVTPATITLPVTNLDEWEYSEGMLVHIPQTLYATDNYNQGRYGEVHLSGGGRLFIPTHSAAPGAPALSILDFNNRDRILMDDGSNLQNPLPLPPYLGAGNTLRLGDTIPDLTGVLAYDFGSYRIHPTTAVSFTRINSRQAAPSAVGGFLKVASFNVLNYFTTIDTGAPICGPSGALDCRGADNNFEFLRQREKIVNAIVTLDADVIGIMELENNSIVSITDLVNSLNAVSGAGTYAFIDTGTIGTDAIRVALIYKPANAVPVGSYAILDSSVDPLFLDTKNRPALAQTFMDLYSNEVFTVAVNHLKSKGSDCVDVGDPDLGDGQGNCNVTRSLAALALVNWLATDPTGSGDPDFLIMGDLNSYAMEDPISIIKNAGYTDLIQSYVGGGGYSYNFNGETGYLDHMLASPSLVSQVTGVTEWHINADEPSALDYNDYNQPALYNPGPYRSSDHDPAIIGLCTDTTKPDLTVTVTPDTLWPANHKYVDVSVNVQITDADPNVTLELVSVVSTEPDNGLGDGDQSNDIVILDNFNFQVRAERSGTGGGRLYLITYRATDACGNTSTTTAIVFVPHDNSK